MQFPKIGNLAPNFSLANQNGDVVELKQFRGVKNVVVYFYPKASTPGCTVQACGIRNCESEFQKLNTVILGISPDSSSKLKKFADKYELNFDLLSDESHSVAEDYGVWGLKKFMGKEFMGIMRTTFIINKDGRLCFIMDKVKTGSHDEELIAHIRTNI